MNNYLNLYVNNEEIITRKPNSELEWDNGCTRTNWSFSALSISKNPEWRYIHNDLNFEPGDKIFIVYSLVNTSDSFGSYTDSNLEFISAHRDYEVAYRNKLILENIDSQEKVLIYNDNRSEFYFFPNWTGYFENLSKIDIEEFILIAGFN